MINDVVKVNMYEKYSQIKLIDFDRTSITLVKDESLCIIDYKFISSMLDLFQFYDKLNLFLPQLDTQCLLKELGECLLTYMGESVLFYMVDLSETIRYINLFGGGTLRPEGQQLGI